MSNNKIIPVILSGGTGSRLWPVSRKSFPKQFLSFVSDDNKSLLQRTQERILKIKNLSNSIIICNEAHRFIVAEQMREIDIKPDSIILEPFGKNTAPAIASAALCAIKKDDDPILLILSSDHVIKEEKNFLEVINKGIDYAKKGRIVTLGIIPTFPNTGYGYIKAKDEFNLKELKGINIEKFIEKPDYKKAKEFITDKRYSWNSGIFIVKAKEIISELNKFHPEILEICQCSLNSGQEDLDFFRLDKNIFENCPNISIDLAVMEKTQKGTIIPLDAGWSDIGSWKSVWENSEKDSDKNVKKGNVFLKNSKNCYLRSEGRLIVGLGLEDLIVVETRDAILISNKSSDQEVKSVVELLKKNGISEGEAHKKEYRPWGSFISIAKENRWQVKLINVKAGEKLSQQLHYHRAEHWVVVKGTAKIEIENDEFLLSENQSCFIPIGSKHRLSNPGKIPISVVEIQSGPYLGEDDIKRFDDVYGRKT